jgi:hypothetical protein
VYASQIDGQPLTLAPSGQLWRGSMVLYDKETWTRWSLLTGEGYLGKHQGRRLQALPAVLTDWKSWLARYPDGSAVVMSRGGPTFRRDEFKDPSRFVLAIADGDKARAWRFDRLVETPALNDVWAEDPVVVMYDPSVGTARVFKRTVGDRVLTFRCEKNRWSDEETDSAWDPITGRATHGTLAGNYLTPLPASVVDRSVWRQFYPQSE